MVILLTLLYFGLQYGEFNLIKSNVEFDEVYFSLHLSFGDWDIAVGLY
ncbi:MAG: hypothetical protein V9F05_17135 [Chitinophagaceae bacterium]